MGFPDTTFHVSKQGRRPHRTTKNDLKQQTLSSAATGPTGLSSHPWTPFTHASGRPYIDIATRVCCFPGSHYPDDEILVSELLHTAAQTAHLVSIFVKLPRKWLQIVCSELHRPAVFNAAVIVEIEAFTAVAQRKLQHRRMQQAPRPRRPLKCLHRGHPPRSSSSSNCRNRARGVTPRCSSCLERGGGPPLLPRSSSRPPGSVGPRDPFRITARVAWRGQPLPTAAATAGIGSGPPSSPVAALRAVSGRVTPLSSSIRKAILRDSAAFDSAAERIQGPERIQKSPEVVQRSP